MATKKKKAVSNFTWSYSKLTLFERCPKAYKLRYVDKVEEEKSTAMERGITMHSKAEAFIKSSKSKLDDFLLPFKKQFAELRKVKAFAEQKWGFTRQWEPTQWSGVKTWLRMITDVYVPSKKLLRIIDHKTGKPYPSHTGQGELYGVGGVEHCIQKLGYKPKLIQMEFWYLDQGHVLQFQRTYDELQDIKREYTNRVAMLEMARAYPASPGMHCNWCQHSYRKGGSCKEK